MQISTDEAECIVAFIKSHEREDIPEDVWDLCMKMIDKLENEWYEN